MSKVLEIVNSAAGYVRRNGGAHWTVTTPCGANASAVRETGKAHWTIFRPTGESVEVAAHFGDDQIIEYLKKLLMHDLIKSLALLA